MINLLPFSMLLMQLQYLICEGIEEPWVEAVHRSWYNEDKKLCFWPPKIKDSSKLRGFVVNGYKPDSDWIGYPAKIRKAYGLFLRNIFTISCLR